MNLPDYIIFNFVVLFSFLSLCEEKRDPNIITASGTIEATEINISSKSAGELIELNTSEGAHIKQGDLIAVIDHSTLNIQLKQAEAGVNLADSQLKLMLRGARFEDIQQAEEMVIQAETGLKMASDDLARINQLYSSGGVTPKQKDDAESRHKIAEAQYNSAKLGLKKIKSLIRPEEIRAARAKLDQANISVELLKKMVSDCYIMSPTDGIVTHTLVEVGELVGQGSIIITISKLEKVSITVFLTEVELGKIKLGQDAYIKIDSMPEKSFKGKIVYISTEAEFTPKNVQTKEDRVKLVYRIKIDVLNPDGILKPGMPADAIIKLNDQKIVGFSEQTDE